MIGRNLRIVLISGGIVLAAGGAVLLSTPEREVGPETHQMYASLGLAMVVLAAALVLMNGLAWIRPAWTEWSSRAARDISASPARLVIAVVVLSGVGAGLLSITRDEGGFMVYHPYDFLGLGIVLLAVAVLIRGTVGLVGRRRALRHQ